MSIFILTLVTTFCLEAKVVRYELTATKQKVNLSGKKSVNFAIMLNGGIPAPLLEFNEGDEAEITLRNAIADDEVSVHWHGILLDSFMDGVPYVSTPPIHPGESFTYKFKLRQHGTYWYHSHTGVQEQKGIYGGIIVHPKKKEIEYDKDFVIVLSDWSDEDANKILANLRKDGDYYLYKKGTMRSWWGAIQESKLKNFLINEWTRMGGMDYSDVGYDAFLINGKRQDETFAALPGEKVRLRIINAAASSYFYISLADTPMKVISADGIDIKPIDSNEILIGMAETYDILFEMPDKKSYEFKATAQDGTGSVSAWIGSGEKVYAPMKPKPDLYALMDHSSMGHAPSSMDHSHMYHEGMDHGQMSIPVLTVDSLQAIKKTSYATTAPTHEVKLILNGDMKRYVWVINGMAIHEDMNLYVNEGEVIRYTFVNETMMHHPMHLHGHFFRVLNQHGEYSPLKHTVDVPPHSSRTIEVYTNEPGEWMFHCHNLYHMKSGMARVMRYVSFERNPVMNRYQKLDPHLHDHFYYRGLLEVATNHAQAEFFLLKSREELELRTELRRDFNWEGEGDLFYKTWMNRWLHFLGGGTMVEGKGSPVVGIGYILPFLLETHTIVDYKGRIRLNLEKRFQWTKYVFTDAEFTLRQKQPSEFEISLMYQKNWSWSAGLMFTEESAGVGLQYNF